MAWIRDLRHSIRGLRREAAALLVAALVIGLGAAAAATMVATAEATLHPSMPYPAPDRLVVLDELNPAKTPRPEPLPPARYQSFKASTELFTQLGAYDTLEQNLTGLGAALRVQTARVTPELLALSGLAPVRGRFLTNVDATSGTNVALISEALWRERFGSTEWEHRTLQLDGQTVHVVGVLPSSYDMPRADVYITLRMVETSRVARHLRVVGRLAAGVNLEQARARMETLSNAAERSHPETDAGWRTIVTPLRDHRVAELRPAVRVLIGAGMFVALIACASVGNLLAVRYVARGQEIAIRVAIGAGRSAIVRLLAIEGLLIGAAGSLVGWCLASGVLPLVSAIGRTGLALTPPSGVAFLVAGSAIALVGSALPVALFLRGNATSLVGRAYGLTNRMARRAGRTGVVLQVAIAVTLVATAMLLASSLSRLLRIDLGLNPDRVLTGRVAFPRIQYATSADLRRFEREAVGAIGVLPDVAAAGLVSVLPMSGRHARFNLLIEGRPVPSHAGLPVAEIRSASPGYFEAAGIRTVAGRSIDQRDIAEASGVVAINETMSRQFWPTEEAIGKRISLTGPDGPWLSIVGIVADVRHDGPSAPVQPEMYRPFAQEPWPAATIVVRTERDASSLVPELIRTIQTIDPSLALHDVRTMEDVVRRSTERPRLWLALVTGFAGLALALALASVFGMMAYTVGQRMPEFALRIALGADPRRLVVLVLNDGAGVLVTGALAGVATASLTAGLVRPLLFGIGPLAPFVLVSGALLVVATGLCACWLPAQRAAAAMPADLLRGR